MRDKLLGIIIIMLVLYLPMVQQYTLLSQGELAMLM